MTILADRQSDRIRVGGRLLAVLLCLAGLVAAPARPQAQDAALPEHPVIKPMGGATPGSASRVDDFGQLVVSYQQDGRPIEKRAEGRFWHLEYQLENAATSRAEIMANYASEARRIGGEVLRQTGTRLVFHITRADGGDSWAQLDTRSGGRYELEIVDEAALALNLEFDADAMLDALTRDGRVAIYGILFDVDRAELQPGSGTVLDTIAGVLDANPALRLEVQGHTDSTGTAERNRQLSLERARTVVSALGLYGVDAGRLVPQGYGPDQPVGDNSTEAGRRRNRRVELVRLP